MDLVISIVVSGRATFARVQTVLESLEAMNCPVEVLATASAVESRYGSVADEIEHHTDMPVIRLESQVESDTRRGSVFVATKTAEQLAEYWTLRRPSIVLMNGDRYETLGISMAARYLGLKLAHIMGGEVSGNVDNFVRDANSALSDLHFPATVSAAARLRRMLQNPQGVYRTGCPSIDLAARCKDKEIQDIDLGGVGAPISLSLPYIIVMLHSVSGEESETDVQGALLAEALEAKPQQVLWFWPNSDPGGQSLSQFMRALRERNESNRTHFIKNLRPMDFLRLLDNCDMIVGNSSAAIREGSFLGVPAINIGSRQQFRERGPNVIDAEWTRDSLASALETLKCRPRPGGVDLYGEGNAGQQIARKLIQVLESQYV